MGFKKSFILSVLLFSNAVHASFWSDIGHAFTHAWHDIVHGVETAVHDVESVADVIGHIMKKVFHDAKWCVTHPTSCVRVADWCIHHSEECAKDFSPTLFKDAEEAYDGLKHLYHDTEHVWNVVKHAIEQVLQTAECDILQDLIGGIVEAGLIVALGMLLGEEGAAEAGEKAEQEALAGAKGVAGEFGQELLSSELEAITLNIIDGVIGLMQKGLTPIMSAAGLSNTAINDIFLAIELLLEICIEIAVAVATSSPKMWSLIVGLIGDFVGEMVTYEIKNSCGKPYLMTLIGQGVNAILPYINSQLGTNATPEQLKQTLPDVSKPYVGLCNPSSARKICWASQLGSSLTCQDGNQCVVSGGADAICSNTNCWAKSGSTVTCNSGANCWANDGGDGSGANVVCNAGSKCSMYGSSIMTCNSGAQCFDWSDGQGTCNGPGCGSITCQRGQTCPVPSGWTGICQAGSFCKIMNGGSATCEYGSTCTVEESGGSATCQNGSKCWIYGGTAECQSGASCLALGTSTINCDSGSHCESQSGGTINCQSGSTCAFGQGGVANCQPGSNCFDYGGKCSGNCSTITIGSGECFTFSDNCSNESCSGNCSVGGQTAICENGSTCTLNTAGHAICKDGAYCAVNVGVVDCHPGAACWASGSGVVNCLPGAECAIAGPGGHLNCGGSTCSIQNSGSAHCFSANDEWGNYINATCCFGSNTTGNCITDAYCCPYSPQSGPSEGVNLNCTGANCWYYNTLGSCSPYDPVSLLSGYFNPSGSCWLPYITSSNCPLSGCYNGTPNYGCPGPNGAICYSS